MSQAQAVGESRSNSASQAVPWIAVSLLGGIVFWLWWWSARKIDIDSIARIVRKRYPKVRQISAVQLAERLASDERKPLLLDVRKFEEYAVSHLPGARWIDPKSRDRDIDLGVPKDAPIVAYCAVGYRSSGFAQRLEKLGYTDVQNLEGSIFKWANDGRPLARGEALADTVHPYSNYWKRLVKPERRATLPG